MIRMSELTICTLTKIFTNEDSYDVDPIRGCNAAQGAA